jgi:Binding-protein-dependent transport system inner membrane component/Bacterial regulatory proteins, gntR family
MAIDPTLPIPVHFQLKTLLIEAILEGDYGLDGRLPTEHQLCERHGISRTPVTRALGEWLSNPGVLHLGFADIRLTNLVLIVPAFWAFTGFGVITLTAGLTAVPYQLVEAAKVDGANAWQAARHILVPALRRPLVVGRRRQRDLRAAHLRHRLCDDRRCPRPGHHGARPAAVAAGVRLPRHPQGGQATAIAVLMSLVLIAGSYPYLRQLIAGRSR